MLQLRFLNGKLQERRHMVPGGLWNAWTDVQSIVSPKTCPANNPDCEECFPKPKDSEVWPCKHIGGMINIQIHKIGLYKIIDAKDVDKCPVKGCKATRPKHEPKVTFESKPKDSEVWCCDYGRRAPKGICEMKDTGEIAHIKYCPFCGKERTRPKPEPVKTLAEKFYDYWKTTTACHGHDACKDLSSIAHEHFKQENRHD